MTSTQDRAGENRSLARVSRAAGTDPGRTGASSPYPPQGELARTPSPVTRAASGRAAARGRGGAQAPAGAALDADSAVLAGSTYTITLPAGLKLLSLNDRLHWRERNSRAQELKRAAWVMALNARVPQLDRVSVVVEYQPPDRRHRDADNISPAGKAALDGIVAARCLPGDDSRHVAGVRCIIGEPFPKGRLVLHLTETPGGEA